MSMNYCLTYDRTKETFWSSRDSQMRQFRELGGQNLKWESCRSTPKNWLGYDSSNPSPGYDLDWHVYSVFNDTDALILSIMGGTKASQGGEL